MRKRHERKPIHQYDDTPQEDRDEEEHIFLKLLKMVNTNLKVFQYMMCVILIAFLSFGAYTLRKYDEQVPIDPAPVISLGVTPGNIEEPCGGPCGDGLECLDSQLQECPCEPGGSVGTTCVDYLATCSCQTKPKEK